MKLYKKYFMIHLKSQMQYKTSFFLMIAAQFISSFSSFLGIYFMMGRFHKIEEFTYAQVLLCFSVVLMAFSLAECFVRGFDSFSAIISNGEFDRIMVRPANEIFQVLASKIEFSKIGRIFQAAVILIYAVGKSEIVWSGDKIVLLMLMIGGGIAVFSGLFIIYAALCFFTTQGLEFINIFTNGGQEFGSYPLVIYGKNILRFLTYIVPLALFQYYPFLYLTEKSDSMLYFLCPVLAGLFLIPAYIIWKIGLRHYKSTGS